MRGIGDPSSRRELLKSTATGFGALALNALLAAKSQPAAGSWTAGRTHLPPRAKRVIFLFMHGGPSHLDTFDYKPLLTRDHGKPMPLPMPRVTFTTTGHLLKSPWEFQQYGESGLWVSDLFPEIAKQADKLCVIKSMHSDNVVHGNAVLQLHTGSALFARPSMGAWITYGLGSENDNLPGFITLGPTYAHGGATNFGSSFLPATYQGTPVGSDKAPLKDARIRFTENSTYSHEAQQAQLKFLKEQNEAHLQHNGADAVLEARIASFELAYRMQMSVPRIMDISDETASSRELYGLDDPTTADFGLQCVLARRLCEAGVRFIQCSHSYRWDQHSNLVNDLGKNAREVDRPIAALLADLERRGLLEETLVLWGGEFGRTPTAEGTDGRDHNPYGYTMWMAGGGVRGGFCYGATDDYGYYSVEDRCHVHDLHATMLFLLGLDHERLTYHYDGRDFRLTDVHGHVVKELLA